MLHSLSTACADAYISQYYAQALDKLEMVCSDGEDCVSLLILSPSPHVCLWTEVLGTCLFARMLWLPAGLHSSPTVSLVSAQAQRNMCVLSFLSFCVSFHLTVEARLQCKNTHIQMFSRESA